MPINTHLLWLVSLLLVLDCCVCEFAVTSVVLRPPYPTVGGDAFAIDGSGWSNGAIVSVGNTECSKTFFISVSELKCKVAPGYGSDLDITIKDGTQMFTQPKAFSYEAPSIVETSPAYGPENGMTTIRISGFNFGGVENVPEISIGNTPCVATRWLDAQAVQCVTPKASELGEVGVKVAVGGQSGFKDKVFKYIAPIEWGTITDSSLIRLQQMGVTLDQLCVVTKRDNVFVVENLPLMLEDGMTIDKLMAKKIPVNDAKAIMLGFDYLHQVKNEDHTEARGNNNNNVDGTRNKLNSNNNNHNIRNNNNNRENSHRSSSSSNNNNNNNDGNDNNNNNNKDDGDGYPSNLDDDIASITAALKDVQRHVSPHTFGYIDEDDNPANVWNQLDKENIGPQGIDILALFVLIMLLICIFAAQYHRSDGDADNNPRIMTIDPNIRKSPLDTRQSKLNVGDVDKELEEDEEALNNNSDSNKQPPNSTNDNNYWFTGHFNYPSSSSSLPPQWSWNRYSSIRDSQFHHQPPSQTQKYYEDGSSGTSGAADTSEWWQIQNILRNK